MPDMVVPTLSGFRQSLLLAGAGKMGGALLRAWLAKGYDPARIHVLDPQPSVELLAAQAHGVILGLPSQPIDILVLGIKPQILDEAAAALIPVADTDTLLVSILAGKTIANLSARFPQIRAIVRAMPNLPAAIGRGITVLSAYEATTPTERASAEALLSAAGKTLWLPHESLIDSATAISGCGPAYVFYLAEVLADAGKALGLPEAFARVLARATIEGAGELLFQSPEQSPAQLRENVTSRGGTTAAALAILMAQDGLAPLVARAVAAAKQRAKELSA
ncbi:MAG: pyrroline-5-carboxylate reductase [Alphaproteobacteria bacterium]|nr:pyrroline-5-carboxylate reductase [Alphaproteobacteria bacterium]